MKALVEQGAKELGFNIESTVRVHQATFEKARCWNRNVILIPIEATVMTLASSS